ncbi:type II toxin-antitoxin system RelE family toxin [Thiorhodovibrio frisius]|uniref:Cytotoxic translational repressor of toxin-antitoxin stability system n=1 Tax=Thiorhodovibrio frisius TaxID=631362 RepID=H8YYT9_9GAMM|nr:type II toxin-antitoxin system RelE/ParE family toxin [Thiorhodovibrio frisius]EIC23615.1 cytotoxic translational repressor of toxin-antitoxin stability system [Thiorhodovibrio frisius]WPL23298.1 Plasmid stabilization system protein [Thiorhodovibrio frisius]
MRIELRNSAIKDLQRIDRHQKERLHEAIRRLVDFPDVPNLKRLTNFEPAYRLRIGDYRVLFYVVDETILVGRVLHRRESYR